MRRTFRRPHVVSERNRLLWNMKLEKILQNLQFCWYFKRNYELRKATKNTKFSIFWKTVVTLEWLNSASFEILLKAVDNARRRKKICATVIFKLMQTLLKTKLRFRLFENAQMMLNWFQFTNISLYGTNFFFLFSLRILQSLRVQLIAGKNCQNE